MRGKQWAGMIRVRVEADGSIRSVVCLDVAEHSSHISTCTYKHLCHWQLAASVFGERRSSGENSPQASPTL